MTQSLLLKLLALIAAGSVINACSAPYFDRNAFVQRYKGNTPTFNIETFFQGDLVAHGVVKSRSGHVERYFTANIKARNNGERITLDEHFYFNDGEQQKRLWTLTPQVTGGYLATANDVPTENPIITAGNALFMEYKLQINYKGRELSLNVDDRMYLVDESTVLNESVFRKFGIKVGSAQLVIKKLH